MMRSIPAAVLCLVLFAAAAAAWQAVEPGIDYRYFAAPGPNDVFVTRMDRADPDLIIESCIAMGRLQSGRETVPAMVARYEDTINYWNEVWGNRMHIVAAINGDYFNLTTGIPTGGQIISGWQARRFGEYSGGSGFCWKLDRSCFLGGNVRNGSAFERQKVFFADGSYAVPTDVNRARDPGIANELLVYTPHFAENTGTDAAGTEVLAEMSRPLLAFPNGTSSYVSAIIRQVRVNAGSTPLPFDHVVLSGEGTAGTLLGSKCQVGGELRFQFTIQDYGTGGEVPTGPSDWTKAYTSVGGDNHYVVKNGIVPSSDWQDNQGAIIRNPRTAVAFNANYIFFVVCDGRSARSVGMTFTELGSFCRDTLGATWAIPQDGGGSSTLWAGGSVRNVPSDGSPRPVANGLMMAVVRPRSLSTRFLPGDLVVTTAATSARLGPGANYGIAASVSSGASGTILAHPLGGVLATGAHWWKCAFGTGTGWVEQSVLFSGHRPADFDGDQDVDMVDFAHFQSCLTGRTLPVTEPACMNARLDADEDVDPEDTAIFLGCMTASGVPAAPGCR